MSLLEFEIYFRNHTQGFAFGTWKLLAVVPANKGTEHVVTVDDLAPGRYDFGIKAVYVDGSRSAIHASTDNNADPPSGWYLNWLGG